MIEGRKSFSNAVLSLSFMSNSYMVKTFTIILWAIEGPNRARSDCVLYVPFILSGSLNECWLHMCCACIIATLRWRLQATRGACNVITVNLHTLSPLPPQKGLETGGGGEKIIVISREVQGWGGMGVFWNYTLQYMYFQVHYGMWLKGFS